MLVLLVVAIGTALTLLGLGIVQAAAVAGDRSRSTPAGRSGPSAPTGWRSRSVRPMLGALVLAVVVVVRARRARSC